MSATLILTGITLPDNEDPLGLWEPAPPETVTFGAGETTIAAPPTWRITLPPDPRAARQTLEACNRAESESLRHLAEVETILRTLNPLAPAYSATDPLLAQKEALIEAVATWGLTDRLTFGPAAEREKAAVDQRTLGSWLTFVEEVRRMLSAYARVETHLGSTPVAQTVVSWGGDFRTHWNRATSHAMRQTHRQAVHLALTSRLALVRLVGVVAVGAATLAAKAAIPGGHILLLPAAWRFVRDVLRELRHLRGQPSPPL